MKRFLISFLLILVLGIIFAFGIFNSSKNNSNEEYLRIHIRANSNLEADQSIKYEVRDAVVDAMIPLIADCKTKQEAENVLTKNFYIIEQTANYVLQKNGFSYASKARLAREEFPTRTYDNLTLEEGFYDALILDLGSGEGNNWWCVVYPPLCFLKQTATGQDVVYKSKLIEIIKSFFE